MNGELKPHIPNAIPVLNHIDGIKEPETAEKYSKLYELDKLALYLLWSKRELSNTDSNTLEDMIARYDKPTYKYKLYAISHGFMFKSKEFDSVKDFMKEYEIPKEDARYLLNYSHRDFITSKCKYYNELRLKCRIYKLKGDDYILESVCEKPFRYFPI